MERKPDAADFCIHTWRWAHVVCSVSINSLGSGDNVTLECRTTKESLAVLIIKQIKICYQAADVLLGKVIWSSFSIISLLSSLYDAHPITRLDTNYTYLKKPLGTITGSTCFVRTDTLPEDFLDHEIRLPTSTATRQMTLLSPPLPSDRVFLMGLNKQILKPLSLYKACKEYTRGWAKDCTQLV